MDTSYFINGLAEILLPNGYYFVCSVFKEHNVLYMENKTMYYGYLVGHHAAASVAVFSQFVSVQIDHISRSGLYIFWYV